jgi:hypothetical protein
MIGIAQFLSDFCVFGIAISKADNDFPLLFIEHGEEILPYEIFRDFGIGAVDWKGIREFDEIDFDFGARMIEFPFKIDAGRFPDRREIVMAAIR